MKRGQQQSYRYDILFKLFHETFSRKMYSKQYCELSHFLTLKVCTLKLPKIVLNLKSSLLCL